MKKIVCLLLIFLSFSLSAQVTIIIDELPEATAKDASIFISGNFEGWSGGNKEYQLKKLNGKHTITLPKKLKRILFKFTQGTWESVECSTEGTSIDNRSYVFEKPNDTLRVKIQGWDHLADKTKRSTLAKNVSVLAKDFEIPELNRKRRVWIYLPPGYQKSKESYPVLYMHDGQNVFDVETSYSGEWAVDETLNKLYNEKNLRLIVVAVDNGGAKRLDEYSPWKHSKYGGGEGSAYVDFIANTLKPHIDNNYRTLKDKENTGIMGSSMGGLISHYAGLQYPKVFGKVGVYSPAFWFAPQVNEFTKEKGIIKDSQFYFLAGGKEGENAGYKEINETVRGMNKIIATLKDQGFPSKNIQSKVVPEGKHNEELWRTNFEETILWLFPKAIKKRTFLGAKFSNDQLRINVSDGTYQMKFYGSKTIETTFLPKGEKTSDKKSHAVVLKSTYSNVQFNENDSLLIFKTDDFSATIKKQPFNISYSYKGEELLSEKNGYRKSDDFETIQFSISPDETLYGGGARALGMNRRGNRLQLYNKADYGYKSTSKLMNYTMPIVASSKKYMVHFDNAPIGYLDLDSQANNTLTYETISGRMTYQVVAGESWLDLLANYTTLTGKQPLPPRWALGNFSSRFGYHSQKETETTIQKFRDEKIPVDAIILDLYWFGKEVQGTMGNLAVYKDSFPDMKGMISRLNNQKVKTVLITEPFILTTSNRWKEAVKEDILAKDSEGKPYTYDFYFGNTGLIDIYNPKGENWFWNIYKEIINMGVKGLWGDLGEPEVHPSELIHATGTANEVHNTYGHDWARLVYEGYQRDFPNERPFILMRAGYSGSQRYGLIPWSGDVSRSWGGLQSQPEISLQMGMQGIAYMHSDLGGFAGANLDDELYSRWLQYGVFQPIYRPHAQEDVASEPVFRSPKAKALAKESIELRYKFLPYNYHLAYQNSHTGAPLMRPLLFEEPSKSQLRTLSSTYLWGHDFLITPILKSGVEQKEVYFPTTSNWYDFYTGEKVIGGQTKSVKTKENSIPTYVRAGAFILMAKPIQSTEEYVGKDLTLHYYNDDKVEKSERKFYNDDGKTSNSFQKGKYEMLEFTSQRSKNEIDITFENEIGEKWTPSKKNIDLVIHNLSKKVRWVKVGRKKVSFTNEKNTVRIPILWNAKKKINIKIRLDQ
ncbi:TIM-barrel domain-containing protein [Pseudotenacibaculum haliotis]|uniref:TIM-barrel domain-containing protein n=1 Tax=Pseudotenacibaculum haliotis TaxID=1862138 RepID=A0ABW5LT42_9FLAO